jgi:hypothetical protein
MGREIGIISGSALMTLQPNDRQIALKMLIHERVSPSALGKLTLHQLDSLIPYIAPFTAYELHAWCNNEEFFHWLLMPESHLLKMQKAKDEAADTVIELLNPGPGSCPKLSMVRLKAAELLLKTDMTKQQRVSNTIKVANHLPKNLVNKSTEALEAELQRLKE